MNAAVTLWMASDDVAYNDVIQHNVTITELDKYVSMQSFSVVGNIILEIFSKSHFILNDLRRYTLEVTRGGACNEYLQHMFS